MSEPPDEPSPEFLGIMQQLDLLEQAVSQLGERMPDDQGIMPLRDYIASRELRERLDRIEQRLADVETQMMDTRAQVGLPQPGDDI